MRRVPQYINIRQQHLTSLPHSKLDYSLNKSRTQHIIIPLDLTFVCIYIWFNIWDNVIAHNVWLISRSVDWRIDDVWLGSVTVLKAIGTWLPRKQKIFLAIGQRAFVIVMTESIEDTAHYQIGYRIGTHLKWHFNNAIIVDPETRECYGRYILECK